MAQKITVRRSKHGERYIITAIRLEPEFDDLYYALGSKFFRDDPIEDDELVSDRPESLPESLSQTEIMDIYRDQFSYWGEANLGRWTDHLPESRHGHIARWLTELVLGAFPDLKEGSG